jgi:hypothetical protein
MEKGLASFEERQATESRGLPEIKKWLESSSSVERVEEATLEQQREMDIDLIVYRKNSEYEPPETVEVKVDTQGHKTGNLALETISNEVRGTVGCFMRTRAKHFFYYFVETGELYRFETEIFRDWFIRELESRPNRWRTFTTHTNLGSRLYPSYGRLVPLEEIPESMYKKTQLQK